MLGRWWWWWWRRWCVGNPFPGCFLHTALVCELPCVFPQQHLKEDTNRRLPTHTYTCEYTHRHTQRRTDTHAHARTHTHAHTHKHNHTLKTYPYTQARIKSVVMTTL